jgi:hypothetical protein
MRELYYAYSTDFPHFFTPDLVDELQKSKFSTAQDNFGKIIGIERTELCFVKV